MTHAACAVLFLVLVACGSPTGNVAHPLCACEGGHGVQTCRDGKCGPCACLKSLPATPRDPPRTRFVVDPEAAAAGDGSAASPWRDVDWPAVDAALAEGDVLVHFQAHASGRGLQILRTDTGPHRLVLDGRTGEARAEWKGATTTEEKVKRSRVTLTGFRLKGSSAQGVYWEAGDGVVLEDLVISDNGKSPAVLFEYANRSGLPSDGLTVRNNHLFDVTGECVYIGGREGTPGVSHSRVLIENNLIHDCGFRDHNGDDYDGINLKDRITFAVVRHNVIFQAHWGIQLTSLDAVVEENVIFDTDAAGIVLGGGGWGVGLTADTRVSDNAIFRAGRAGAGGTSAGIYVDADAEPARGPVFRHNTIADVHTGPAMMLAGTAGLSVEISNAWLTGSAQGLDGWGDVQVTSAEGTAFFDNGKNHTRAADVATVRSLPDVDPRFGGLDDPAGADQVFFTVDDGWLSSQAPGRGAALR